MKREKEFDAVKMMRELREQVSREIEGMTYEEQRRYLDECLRTSTLRKPPEEQPADEPASS